MHCPSIFSFNLTKCSGEHDDPEESSGEHDDRDEDSDVDYDDED